MADNQQPQRDQDVVTYRTFTGLRNDVNPERFDAGDLAVASNVNLDKSGSLSRRDGYTSQVAGAAHSLWSNPQGSLCLFCQGTALYQLNADYSTTPLRTLTCDLPVSYVQAADRVYFSNGVDTGVLDAGAVRSWGLPVPALPAVSLGTGMMPAGRYQLTMTWLRADMQESGAGLAMVIDVPQDNSALVLSDIPVSADPTVVGKIVYVSPFNGELLYAAMTLPNAQTAAIYANDTTELTRPLDTQFLQPAPAGQIVAYYRGRLYVASGDTLYASEGYGYEWFDLRKYLQLDGRITMLAPITDHELFDRSRSSGFFVGTDQSCGVLIGGDSTDMQYVPKTSYGAIEGSLAMVDASLLGGADQAGTRELPVWLTTAGVCAGMPEMLVKNFTRSRFTFDVGSRGAALFQPGQNRLIFCSNN